MHTTCLIRVVYEHHDYVTKKYKEWQEKLPVVVLKAEKIMYSKANSENGGGGFATYEITRSYSWMELCTSTAIQALTSFKKRHRKKEVECCIEKAVVVMEEVVAPRAANTK